MCENLSPIFQEKISGQKPGLRFPQELQGCTAQRFLTERLPWRSAQIQKGSWGKSVAEDIQWSCSISNPPAPSSCHECLKLVGEEQAQAGISREGPVGAAIADDHWLG